jgi:hypothetical protein
MEEMKRIVLPFAWSSLACPVMLCCCGLRGWRGTISGRDVRHTFVSLAKQFCDDLLISELSRLINNAHNEFAADRRRETGKNAEAETCEVIKIEHLVGERRCMM